MSEVVTCFACDNEPTRQCSRCGRPYCDDHGSELCDACLEPSSGVPSFSLYRGSLLALLIGTALSVWLLVQPTSSEGDGIRPVVLTPTTTAARSNTTPGPEQTQPAGATTPRPQTTPGAQTTQPPAITGTPRPSTTPATGSTPAAGANTYTVVSGDTLSGICAARRPNIADCVQQVMTLNGITDATSVGIGDVLRLP